MKYLLLLILYSFQISTVNVHQLYFKYDQALFKVHKIENMIIERIRKGYDIEYELLWAELVDIRVELREILIQIQEEDTDDD